MELKEKLKKVARWLAPKNNRVTAELRVAIPYVVMGMAIGAILLHSWIGQPATIKGVVEIPEENIYSENSQELVQIENPMFLRGQIQSWDELRAQDGETVALSVIVIDAGTIETEVVGPDNVYLPPDL
jgi:hypothetical protein